MPTTIRLARHGAKKNPFYRVVVTSSRAASDHNRLDLVGTYDPRVQPPAVKLDADKITAWLRKGAQPSETVSQLIKRSGIVVKPAAAEPEAAS